MGFDSCFKAVGHLANHLLLQVHGALGQQFRVRGNNVKGWAVPVEVLHPKILRKIGKAVRTSKLRNC